MSPNPAPLYSKEIRFAVVMYGGVSLAIYINGVTQELFKMVRATARKEDGSYLIPAPDPAAPSMGRENVLSGTEMIYRQIGEELNARFVVDILSGTSAGGINAVYLAKALVNDQSLDQLKAMWVNEGDIALLVNDRQSTQGLPRNLGKLLNQKPRTSLLNSQRMYYKLLEAFDNMEKTTPAAISPYVDTIDLFVTTTDLQGLSSTLRISQQDIYELRYRNVFHFEYSTDGVRGYGPAELTVKRNDFTRPFNPFLSFAARCTSSFPFAFEPMTLSDIKDILNSSAFYKDYKYEPGNWRLFFEDYLRPEPGLPLADREKELMVANATTRFEERPFGDGGYLDNKPFSYTTKAIFDRQNLLPVDRKLLYIEPSPERLEVDNLKRERPDAFANVFSALLTLPRYETIREDLQLISEHNRVVRRLQGTTELAMKVISENASRQKFWHQSSQRKQAWEKKNLRQMIAQYGEAYGVYHQLRVSQVTDHLAGLITQKMGSEEESALWKTTRTTLKAWREENYAPNPDNGQAPENEFLYKFDVGWRIRRLRFMLYILDQLFDNSPLSRGKAEVDAKTLFAYTGIKKVINTQTEEYRAAVCATKRDLNKVLSDLNQYMQRLPTEALILCIQREQNASEAMDQLVNHIHEVLRTARINTEQALGRNQQIRVKGIIMPLQAIQACLLHYFDLFEYFDLMTFPIQYASPLGEADEVDVWRISPEDAKSIIDEVADKKKKLMGTKLGNFGGFFNREWRLNDILWGRLDGADRIISALIAGTPFENKKAEYVQKANIAILHEELLHEHDTASEPLMSALLRITAKLRKDEAISKVPADGKNPEKPLPQADISFDNIVLKMGPDTIKTILRNNLPEHELLEIFKESQKTDVQLQPEATLAVAGRAAQVMAGLLENLSTDYKFMKKRTAWIYNFGQVVWAVVQIAIPDSFWNILFRRWITFFYAAEVLLIAGGKLLANPVVTSFGWKFFAITAGTHVIIATLSSYLRGKQIHLFLRNVLLIFVLATAVILGFIGLSHFNQDIIEPLMQFFGL